MGGYANTPPHKVELAGAGCNEQSLWEYCGVSEVCSCVDLGKYHTYGICVNGHNFSEIVHDVSCCKDEISRMTYLFNTHQLSPIHFKDAVEDMIGFSE